MVSIARGKQGEAMRRRGTIRLIGHWGKTSGRDDYRPRWTTSRLGCRGWWTVQVARHRRGGRQAAPWMGRIVVSIQNGPMIENL